MSSKRVKNKYPCKQTELYAIITTYILGIMDYQPRFAAHNSNYSAAQGSPSSLLRFRKSAPQLPAAQRTLRNIACTAQNPKRYMPQQMARPAHLHRTRISGRFNEAQIRISRMELFSAGKRLQLGRPQRTHRKRHGISQ